MMMKRASLLTPFFLSIFLLIAACSSTRFAEAPATVDREALLAQVNELRAAGCTCGGQKMPSAPPLQWNARLAEAAQAHSDHMDRWNRFNHKGLWGSQPGSRAQRAGYQWRTVGENIAKGQRSATEVVRSWRNSPGHCRNLMNAGFTEMGAATSGPYWTQVLAAPR